MVVKVLFVRGGGSRVGDDRRRCAGGSSSVAEDVPRVVREEIGQNSIGFGSD